MLRGLERRLARCATGAALVTAACDTQRAQNEADAARASVAEMLRLALIRHGLDPNEAACLRREAERQAEREAAPEPTPEPYDPIDEIEQKLARLAAWPRDDPPSLANASMAQLFAFYCLADESAA